MHLCFPPSQLEIEMQSIEVHPESVLHSANKNLLSYAFLAETQRATHSLYFLTR